MELGAGLVAAGSLAGVRRVSMVGNSGSGKSTLGRALAARLDVPYVELDAIFHQPNWTPLPNDEFRARVATIVDGHGWVIDGNYSVVRDLVWARSDTVVWLDPPRRIVMRRIVLRTLRRVATRQRLWNGNHERLSNLVTRDAHRNIVLWAWREHAKYRQRYGAAARDPEFARLRFVRIGSRRDIETLLANPEHH